MAKALYDLKLTEQELNVIVIVFQNAMVTGAVPRAWVARVKRIQDMIMIKLDEELDEEEFKPE